MKLAKRNLFALFLVLLILSPLFSFVSAEPTTNFQLTEADIPSAEYGASSFAFFTNWNMSARWNLWKNGYSNLKTTGDFQLLGETLRYLVLIIVVLAAYSAFTAMEFPSGAPLRILLAIIVGLLGTFMITTNELITALLSYSALTTTIILAIPIFVLLGFTIIMAYKAKSAGLFASRILWATYALLLFFKGILLIILSQNFRVAESAGRYVAYPIVGSKVPSYLSAFLPNKLINKTVEVVINNVPTSKNITIPAPDPVKIGQMMGGADISTAWIFVISAIAIFVVMVGSRWVYVWLDEESKKAAIESVKSNSELRAANDKIQADIMRNGAKT